MKKKLILSLATIMIFALAVATFAYVRGTASGTSAASCCCCSGDSCPDMKKDADGKVVAGSHENCCGDADSCPMIKKDAAGKQVAGGGHSCCCCGDGESCPMKDKAAAATVTAVSNESAITTVSTEDAKNGETAECPMMKKGDGSAMEMKHGHHHMMKDGNSCSCSCCDHNKEKRDAPVGDV